MELASMTTNCSLPWIQSLLPGRPWTIVGSCTTGSSGHHRLESIATRGAQAHSPYPRSVRFFYLLFDHSTPTSPLFLYLLTTVSPCNIDDQYGHPTAHDTAIPWHKGADSNGNHQHELPRRTMEIKKNHRGNSYPLPPILSPPPDVILSPRSVR